MRSRCCAPLYQRFLLRRLVRSRLSFLPLKRSTVQLLSLEQTREELMMICSVRRSQRYEGVNALLNLRRLYRPSHSQICAAFMT